MTIDSDLRERSRGFAAFAAPFLVIVAVAGLVAQPAAAEDGEALRLLKAMSDFVSQQEKITLTFDSDVEVVTPAVEKIQFASSGRVVLNRPDRFRVSRTGGYADVEIIANGKTVTVFDRDRKRFAEIPASGGFDEVVERLRTDSPIEVPGADLLLSKPYEELTAGVIEAKHVGRGVIDGVECDHLAFRNLETDWQIWIESGERPLPRKYVITSKGVGGAPQYTLRMKDWTLGGELAADTFDFKPPAGSAGVSISILSELDEVPEGIVPGGRK